MSTFAVDNSAYNFTKSSIFHFNLGRSLTWLIFRLIFKPLKNLSIIISARQNRQLVGESLNALGEIEAPCKTSFLEPLLYPQNIGGLPREMLSSVDTEQLTGDRRRIQKIPQCGGDVSGIGTARQHCGGTLRIKVTF